MIQFKNVERSYKTAAGQTWVLRRINLEIREGEFITVMGPSGAGKSSLLNALALLDDQWAGEYWFREQAVHEMKRKARADLAKKNIGMVFQSYHLLDDLTVQENIDLPLSYKDIPRHQRQSLVADVLDKFQIVAKKDLVSQPTIRRTTAAGWRSQSRNSQAGIASGRRTHRQPAFCSSQGDHGTISRTEPAGNNNRAGHTFGSECSLRKPRSSVAGWLASGRLSQPASRSSRTLYAGGG